MTKIIPIHKSLKSISIHNNQSLNILQFTDLHLMNDEKDEMTFKLIKDMISYAHPNFIVFTGDQTMSKDAVILYQRLGKYMDQFEIFYTYVFGNHDTEHDIKYQDLIEAIASSKYLIFDQGPIDIGYSNHQILATDENNQVIASLVMLDTHIDDTYHINHVDTWGYGSISKDQIKWYEQLSKQYPYPQLIFFHIPLPEVKEVTKEDNIHQGDYFESPCTPPVNTGFFAIAKKLGYARAMFFGHDHYNDFVYQKDNITLAYGRVSGHYDYANHGFPKGARLITLDHQGVIKTKVILHQDITK